MTDDTCKDHSGCVQRIGALEANHIEMKRRVDLLINRVNVAIGALVINLLLMLLDLFRKAPFIG